MENEMTTQQPQSMSPSQFLTEDEINTLYHILMKIELAISDTPLPNNVRQLNLLQGYLNQISEMRNKFVTLSRIFHSIGQPPYIVEQIEIKWKS
jgi:hypothetical protein